MCSNVFLAVNASLRRLINVSGVYLTQVSLLLIGQQGLVDFSCIGPCFPLAGELCELLRRRNTTNTAPTTLSAI